MRKGYANIPKPFMGTPKQRERNLATHQWMRDGDEGIRCGDCDCRYYGGVSFWPCGREERIDVKIGSRYAVKATEHVAVAAVVGAELRNRIDNREDDDDGE